MQLEDELVSACLDWRSFCTETRIEGCLTRKTLGMTLPLAPQVIGGLHEQLVSPAIQRVTAFVEGASTDAGLVSAFHVQAGELAKLAAEARDNLKFLATLERHFQVTGGCRRVHLAGSCRVLRKASPFSDVPGAQHQHARRLANVFADMEDCLAHDWQRCCAHAPMLASRA